MHTYLGRALRAIHLHWSFYLGTLWYLPGGSTTQPSCCFFSTLLDALDRRVSNGGPTSALPHLPGKLLPPSSPGNVQLSIPALLVVGTGTHV